MRGRLLRLHDTGASIVLISGNHDSARRLGFGSGLLDAAGVHLRTRISAVWRGRCCWRTRTGRWPCTECRTPSPTRSAPKLAPRPARGTPSSRSSRHIVRLSHPAVHAIDGSGIVVGFLGIVGVVGAVVLSDPLAIDELIDPDGVLAHEQTTGGVGVELAIAPVDVGDRAGEAVGGRALPQSSP